MNIIPNLPILHSKKTVGKFVFTQNYLQSLLNIYLSDIFLLSVVLKDISNLFFVSIIYILNFKFYKLQLLHILESPL